MKSFLKCNRSCLCVVENVNTRFYLHFPQNDRYTPFADLINDSKTRSEIVLCENI